MADLEDIVRKRRSSLEEGDRRQFSVARVEAVRKMRKFALEDPRYYLLELIQSAVANGTGFISIDLFRVDRNRDELKMRWTGDGFSRIEMLNLFDVLLESERDASRADIQMFARAVNAMLLFEPKRLLLASGGRGRTGVTCEVRGDGSEIVELRNTSDFDGVHIFASGMKDSRLPQRRDSEQRLYYVEKELIQERCVMPDVSVVFNGREVSHITWTLHDREVYPEDVVHVDEDDLYGELWPSPVGKRSFFDLMTWGVKIDRVQNDFGPFAGVSGAVVFNKLKKTADHAKIVRDENFDRLWARLRPYAELLQGKREELGFDVARPGTHGRALRPEALMEELVGAERILMVAPQVDAGRSDRDVARQLAESLDARLLVAEPDQDSMIRLLAGDKTEVFRTDFSADEVRFFRSEPVGPPSRPWLVEAAEPQAIPVEDFTDELIRSSDLPSESEAALREALGTHGSVRLRVYTPEALEDGDDSLDRRWVRVLTCEREVWSGGLETAFPGHILYVDLPPAAPSGLRESVAMRAGGRRSVAALVGEHAVREARDELEWATSKALDALGRATVEAGSHASRLALHALGRQTVLSLSPDDAYLRFSMLASEPDRSLLSVPLFEDARGGQVDGQRLEELLQVGLVRAIRDTDGVDLAALDVRAEDVLVVDDEQERLLTHIIGGDAFARLDVDVAMPDATIGAEGADAARLLEFLAIDEEHWGAQERRRRARRSMIDYLVLLDRSLNPSRRSTSPSSLPFSLDDTDASPRSNGFDLDNLSSPRAAQDFRRGVLVRCEQEDEPPEPESLLDLPIVETVGGGPTSMRQVFAVVEAKGAVVMSDGRSVDVVAPLDSSLEPRQPPFELAMNPYLAHVLRGLEAVSGLEDATVVTDASEKASIARIAVESSNVRGFLAIPTDAPTRPVVSVVDRASGEVTPIGQEARRFGVVGTLAVDDEREGESLVSRARQQIEHNARLLLEEQMGQMSTGDPAEQARRLEVLLEYAGRYVRVSEAEQGRVDFDVIDDLAIRILELPLFPTTRGVPVSGMRLLREFARAESVGESLFLELADSAPAPARAWAERHLDADTIYRETREPSRPIEVDAHADLFEQLEGLFTEMGLGEQAEGAVELMRWPEDRAELVGMYGFNRNISVKLERRRRLFVLVEGEAFSAATLVTGHPLLEELEGLDVREQLSWLMLGVYSCINEARVEVRNEHELAFQRRLAERLLAGGGDDELE
ncbi:MAG: hypothetical protein ACQEVA_22440 [Myxococcota bacterium]